MNNVTVPRQAAIEAISALVEQLRKVEFDCDWEAVHALADAIARLAEGIVKP